MPDTQRTPEAILRRLEWTVLKKLDGLLQGDYRTFFRGFGLDLADLREYQMHDDVRHIDWNVTARMDVPHVRQYNEDREVTAWFLLDLSPSVDFGSEHGKKRAIATEFTASLARLLTKHGNRVGAMFYGSAVDAIIPARTGRQHVLHILDALMSRPELPIAPATDLADFLKTALSVINRRSIVFVLSDFISTPGWEKPLGVMARRNELLAVRLFDPLEMELPDMGLFVMQDAETGEQVFVDTHNKGFRKRFAAAAEKREYDLRTAFGRAGVDAIEMSTEDDVLDSLMRFAHLRKQRSRMSGGGTRAPKAATGAF